ncbi:PREDICTED: uncharacterized protein LOC107065755 isoform X1 [Polistes dominula]|uniref:Uncharacterized protein LOC107065755 isoform X1 n=1 Tax=Polistes dominula TaxID=743375 RepID=A0ABM1I4R8_POLDO|nr:PREDICTED: uncharacterized protein LOC107065755 isoform X1 [Polistes dominula]
MYNNKFILFIFTLHYVIQYINAQYCYPNYCENEFTTKSVPASECHFLPLPQSCYKYWFDGFDIVPSGENPTLFKLSANVYRMEEFQRNTTTINLLVTDIDYLRLTIRYQSLLDENNYKCMHVSSYGNKTDLESNNKFSLSCSFLSQSYEGSPYRLQYFVARETWQYSKKLVFIIPHHESIDEQYNNVTTYLPFIYVDVTDAFLFTLYIQPVPAIYNVTGYRIWLINNDTDITNEINVIQSQNEEYINYDFSMYDGIYYFKVAAMHPDCSIYGCVNATSPFISIKDASKRLIIMIISVIWIPPALLYALCHLYKLCKKNAKKRRRKPNCLIVYSPTCESHVTVMTELTKYLRCCNINAVIDMLDISETASKDVELWCKTAFNSADIILFVTSPPFNKHISMKYENVGSYILKLIREDFKQRNKRYYILQLPYCKPTDLPKEAQCFQHFQRFHMPEELAKLVKTVHRYNCVTFFGLSNKDKLLESIKLAQMEMLNDGTTTNNDHKSADETDDLLPSVVSSNNIKNEDLNNEDNNSTSMNDLKDEHNLLKPKIIEIEDEVTVTVHLNPDEK